MYNYNRILETIGRVLDHVSVHQCEGISRDIQTAGAVFVAGVGRSGLVAKFFAMRLKHLGVPAWVVGETTTPKIQEGDILIAITGSGNTQTIVELAKKANELGAVVWAITSNKGSLISIYADRAIQIGEQIPSPEKVKFMPLGTAFELSTLTFLETVVGYIIEKDQITEGTLQSRHANLE